MASVESMVVDFVFGEEILHILNIYHRTHGEPHHNLLHLLSLDMDPLTPTIIMGDFNTHSLVWSFPYSTISPWAAELVSWFDDQGFELWSPPRVVMWDSSRDDC